MTAGPRVLVVDDSQELRRLMVIVLERAGLAVESAADGEEALAMAGASPPEPHRAVQPTALAERVRELIAQPA